jgi:rfaE bifunctional protein nucleotidyltransferase chain/domain
MARMSALAAARVAAPSTVLCHGVFDVLHIGHKRHLEEARSLGDRLVVSITADEHVNKGPGRPVFTAEQRKEMLLALDCVDDVIIAPGPTAKASIEQVRPAVYVKGIDYRDTENPHHLDDVQAVEAMGGRCVITASDKWSSSRIINGERLSDEALAYLDRVRDRGWFPQIQQAFAAADRLNILLVGETIIDEYRYVQALAKPSKEFILATVEAREPEQFLGGVVAAGLHADWANVKVVSDDGEPIKKTRFVDADFGRKLFEVYSRPTLALDDMQRLRFQDRLERDLPWAGVVIVLDFGHGLMTEGDRIALTSSHRFVAVNAQTNAGNNGFNPVTKYRRADLVCVDLPEARLASGGQHDDPSDVAAVFGDTYRNLIITHGRHGSYCPGHVPAFGTRAIDTMGAGDAFLVVTAPLVAAGLDLEAATFVGNVAGAIKCETVGHRKHVERGELLQAVESLLK